jgi:predicted dehydrogenase
MTALTHSLVHSLVHSQKVTLVVHENFRWQPWHRELRSLLHKGTIGECYSVCFRMRPGDGQGNPPSYVARQPYFQQVGAAA